MNIPLNFPSKGELNLLEMVKEFSVELIGIKGDLPFLIIHEDNGVVVVNAVEIVLDLDNLNIDSVTALHNKVLGTISSKIQIDTLNELVICYTAFKILEERGSVVPLLMLHHYCEEKETFLYANLSFGTVGSWQEVPEETPLEGFRGLWKYSRSYKFN